MMYVGLKGLMVVMGYFVDVEQLGLEAVVLGGGVGEGGADAVFAHAAREDVQLVQSLLDARHRCTHLVLHLDDEQRADVGVDIGGAIVEADAAVDGDALAHALVDESDALEAVFQTWVQRGHRVGGVAVDESRHLRHLQTAIEQRDVDGNSHLAGLPLVVFVLDFEEGGVGGAVGAHTQLLAVEFFVVVHGVHAQVVGVEIEGAVGCQRVAVDMLHVVVGVDAREQRLQHVGGGHILLVDAVHQAHGLHVVEADGCHPVQS